MPPTIARRVTRDKALEHEQEDNLQDLQEKLKVQEHTIHRLRSTINALQIDTIPRETLQKTLDSLSDGLAELGALASDVTALRFRIIPGNTVELSLTKV